MTSENPYHRLGEPGGPTCRLAVMPISIRGADGELAPAELLDAGTERSEVELLRTIVSRMGMQWGHDDFGWWAVVRGGGFPSWAVWRQDDSGTKYPVESNLTEPQAHALVAEFEAKGHKQAYWCVDEIIK